MNQSPKKKKPTPGIRRQLPEEFLCIAPDEAKHVVNWLSGSAHGHEKEIAQLHYHLCLRCQEAAGQLLRRAETSSPKEYLHPGTSTSQPPARLNGSPVLGHEKTEHPESQTVAPVVKLLSMKAGGEG